MSILPETPRIESDDFTGTPLDFLARTLDYNQFAKEYNRRKPCRPELFRWCLEAALDSCKLDVVRFLFDEQLFTIGDVRRESMPHLVLQWSHVESGPRMMEWLLERGLDIHSPIHESGNTISDCVRLNGVPAAIDFLTSFTQREQSDADCKPPKCPPAAP